MSDRDVARRQLGAAAIFSEAEAVRLLPVRDSTAREWLREHELVKNHPKLGRIVLWQHVLDAIDRGEGPVDPAEVPPRGPSKLPRAGLRR
jgi:hypothetical protein